MSNPHLCPVCEKHIFNDEYEYCPICHWQSDFVQHKDLDYWGGANELSVNEAKIYYQLSLCKEKRKQLKIISDKNYNNLCEIHQKYQDINYHIDGDKIHAELCKEHDEFVRQLKELQ